MMLYMAQCSDAESVGAAALGYLKSQDSLLHVDFCLAPSENACADNSVAWNDGRRQRKAGQRASKALREELVKEVSLRLHQDLGTLSREQGDTGMSRVLDLRRSTTLTFR